MIQNNWIKILLPAVFIGTGVILLAISCIIRHINAKKKRICTAQTDGIVCRLEPRRGISAPISEDFSPTIWVPTYEYAVNQKVIKQRSKVGYSEKDFEKGQTVSIYYNPKNPTCIYVPNRSMEKIHILLYGIGIAFLCVGVGAWLLCWKI